MKKHLISLKLLIAVLVSIFVTEAVIMLVLPRCLSIPSGTMALLDSIVLTSVIFPVIYLLLFRPLILSSRENIKVNEALLEAKDRYYKLFQYANDSIFIIDPLTLRFMDANQNAVTLLGYPREKLLEMTINDIDTTVSAGGNQEIINKIKEAESIIFDSTHRRKDGSIIPVEISSRIIDYGDKEVIQNFVRDISRRRLIEKELNDLIEELVVQREFSDTVFNNAGSGMLAMDNEGNILKINHAGKSILDIETDYPKGKNITTIAPELKEMFVHTDELYNRIDITVKDGIRRTIGFTNSRLFDTKGKETGIIAVFRDLTEIKELQEEIGKKQQFEDLGRLTSGVAHEVRNPLNAITALIEALSLGIGENEEQKTMIFHINAQVDRLSLLMRELLDFGKPADQFIMSRESVSSICSAAIDLWNESNTSDKHGVSLTNNCNGSHVFVDSQKFQHVMLNLIQNAAQHSPDGSEIKLTVDCRENSSVNISVIDQGAGIPSEYISRVFEPFFTMRRGGTGLGLSIVKHFIDLHGGEIRISNNDPAPGCTVEINLPLHKETDNEG